MASTPAQPRTVLLAAGGTGGHIFPGLATAHALRTLDPDLRVEFVGTKDRMEATLVPDDGWHLHTVEAMALPKKTDPRILTVPFVIGRSITQVRQVITSRNVIAACGFGGYTSVALGLGAKVCQVPLVIHEQNAVPGITNRWLAKIATRVVGTYPETMTQLGVDPAGAIGNPVRRAFAQALEDQGAYDRDHACQTFGLDPRRAIILVFGGSQGAKTLNEGIIAASHHLDPARVQILHATGEKAYETISEAWHTQGNPDVHRVVVPFIAEMATALTLADGVVARSGASTLAELSVVGVPAILVPYPYATGDHQRANAQAFVDADAGILIDDHSLTGEVLATRIQTLIEPKTNAKMRQACTNLGRPRAALDLANMILEVAR